MSGSLPSVQADDQGKKESSFERDGWWDLNI